MKKISIITISIVFIAAIIISVAFNLICPIFDKIFIETSIEVDLEENNYSVFNGESCSNYNLTPHQNIACGIFKQSEFNKKNIEKLIGNKYKFNKTNITKQLEISSKTLSLIMPRVYDIYNLKYSRKYKAKWEYSYFNPVKNYHEFSKRLAVVLLTPSIFNNNIAFKKGDNLIIITETKTSLLARRIYNDTEEMLVFLK